MASPLHVSKSLKDAKQSAAAKALRKGDASPARTLLSVVMIGGALAGAIGYVYLMFGGNEVQAHETVESSERWDAEELRARLPKLRAPKEVPVRRELPREEQPASEPKEASRTPTTGLPVAPMRLAFNWDDVHRRAAGPIAVSIAEEPGPSAEPAQGFSTRNLRHIPRGTQIGPCLLETPVVSDNLDGVVRIRLLGDFEMRGEVVFPAGTRFIGDVSAVADRWQHLVEVRVTNAVLDGEREAILDAILLDVTEQAHLEADAKYHTGKATFGIAALAALGAVSGYAGRTADTIPALAGAQTAQGLSDLASERVERVLNRPPTLFVEEGRLCWVLVTSSLDQPVYESLPEFIPVQAPPEEGPSLPRLPDMTATLERMDALRETMEGLNRDR